MPTFYCHGCYRHGPADEVFITTRGPDIEEYCPYCEATKLDWYEEDFDEDAGLTFDEWLDELWAMI